MIFSSLRIVFFLPNVGHQNNALLKGWDIHILITGNTHVILRNESGKVFSHLNPPKLHFRVLHLSNMPTKLFPKMENREDICTFESTCFRTTNLACCALCSAFCSLFNLPNNARSAFGNWFKSDKFIRPNPRLTLNYFEFIPSNIISFKPPRAANIFGWANWNFPLDF